MDRPVPVAIHDRLPKSVDAVWQSLLSHGHTVLVGGSVRDWLLGKAPHDWDLATALTPDIVLAIGQQAGYRVVPTGLNFGTVTWLTEAGPVEITTFRRDGRYVDGRHPQMVTFGDTLEEDLARRDFTMNAMAIEWDGRLVDPFGGARDLQAGQIVAVGRADHRFAEDPLRMMRAVRFTGLDHHGHPLALAPSVMAAIQRLKPLLLNVSAERQRDELMKLLDEPHFGSALRSLDASGLLGIMWPEWVATQGFDQQTPYHPWPLHEHLLVTAGAGPSPLLRLTGLLHDIGKPSCFWVDEHGTGHFYDHERLGAIMARRLLERLAFDRAAIDRVSILIAQHMFPWESAGAKTMRRMIREHGDEIIEQLLELRRMDVAGQGRVWDPDHAVRNTVTSLLQERPPALRHLAINGHAVMHATGVQPGPAVGRYLEALHDWVDEDPARNTPDQLLQRLHEIAGMP